MNNYYHIIEGVRTHDTQAQMAFYDLFFQPVYQCAYLIVGNRDEAEEIMQDTIMKVLLKTALLHEDVHSMQRILRRIAINHAIDVVRKRKDFFTAMADDQLIEPSDDAADENDISIERIKEGIDDLPVVYRSIVCLRLFEEMSFSAIAAQLKMNPSTVRVNYTRGIAKLRVNLLQKQIYYECSI